VELVHQRRLNIIEELGAHDVSRLAFCFSETSQKRIRELLSIAEVLDYHSLQTRKPTDNSASISAFLRSEVEIVQISAILEKQKRFLFYMFTNALLSLLLE
jgi:hypothetical protein